MLSDDLLLSVTMSHLRSSVEAIRQTLQIQLCITRKRKGAWPISWRRRCRSCTMSCQSFLGEEQSGGENTNTWPTRHSVCHGNHNPYSCMTTRCHVKEGYCGGVASGRGENRGVAELYRPTRPADEVSCCVVGRGMTILVCYLAGTLQ